MRLSTRLARLAFKDVRNAAAATPASAAAATAGSSTTPLVRRTPGELRDLLTSLVSPGGGGSTTAALSAGPFCVPAPSRAESVSVARSITVPGAAWVICVDGVPSEGERDKIAELLHTKISQPTVRVSRSLGLSVSLSLCHDARSHTRR